MKILLLSIVLSVCALCRLSGQRPTTTHEVMRDPITDSLSRGLAPSQTQAMSWIHGCAVPSDSLFDSLMSNADFHYDGYLSVGGYETVWLSDKSHLTWERIIVSSTQCCRFYSSWFMRLMYSSHLVYLGTDSMCDSSAYLVDSSGLYLFDMVALDLESITESKFSDRQLADVDSVRRHFIEWVDYVSDSGIALARGCGYSPLPPGFSWQTFEHRRRTFVVEDLDKLLEQ